jgi:hypothetical protein
MDTAFLHLSPETGSGTDQTPALLFPPGILEGKLCITKEILMQHEKSNQYFMAVVALSV